MNTTLTTSVVTDAHRRHYETEGYMILERVIPESMLTLLREECSYFLGYCDARMDLAHVTVDGLNRRGSRYFISNRYSTSKRMANFIFSPLMADIAQATIGPNAYLFHEQWVVKGAEQGMKFGWHQDSGYVGSEFPHRPYVTCWCTLDDVNEANGTVYVLPTSRRDAPQGLVEHQMEAESHDMLGYTGGDPGVPVIAPAGSIVAFTSHVLHRSGANTSSGMRRIYLPQYSPHPIQNKAGELRALGIPFVQNGKRIYDPAIHTIDRFASAAVRRNIADGSLN